MTVTATDDDATTPLSGSLAVIVTVTDLEEEGVVTIAPPRSWVDPPTRFSAALTDDDGVTGVTWQWARSANGRSNWGDITGATLSSYTADANDVDSYLRASVAYTDRRGSNKTASAALTAPIGETRPTTNNAMPEFAAETDTRSIRQGTAAGRAVGSPVRATYADRDNVLTYLLSGTDAAAFDIDAATGQLRTKAVLVHDPEGTNTYTVTVGVHDGFNDSYGPDDMSADTIEVTITVTQATATGRVANLTATAQGTSQIDLAWSRPAGSRITGYRLERKTGSDSYSPVTPVPAAGATTYEDTGLSAGTTYTYRLRAVNSAGTGRWSDEAEVTTASPPQTRRRSRGGGGGGGGGGGFVSGPAPTFDTGASTTIYIAGNSPEGTDVGLPVVARDANNASLTYSLGGPDAAYFTVDQTTGQIRVRAGTDLDYGSGRSAYIVQVTATTSILGSSTVTVTIKVTSAVLGKLGGEYDANRNEVIEKDEAIAAIVDYFADRITKEEAIEIIKLYFAS